MNTDDLIITIGDIAVHVVRKDIKNLHLGVYPPDGRVRVAAPLAVSDNAVRLAVIRKISWIKRKKEQFAKQPRQSKREMVSGESHYYLGQRKKLYIINEEGKADVQLKGKDRIVMRVPKGTGHRTRELILGEWYRRQFKGLMSNLLSKWQNEMGIKVNQWGIKIMKTKWGSCNRKAKRIWMNLELIKKPQGCIEYIIVHEMAHILEKRHDAAFQSIMDKYCPKWRYWRKLLNAEPLSYTEWYY